MFLECVRKAFVVAPPWVDAWGPAQMAPHSGKGAYGWEEKNILSECLKKKPQIHLQASPAKQYQETWLVN